MTRMTVTVDEELLAAAQKVLGTATKVDTIRVALEQTLRRKKLAGALEHRGQIQLLLDQKKLAKLRETQ